ncbi:Hypothetical_protein [Hexamita inflata]|uniref:Hypothetical_protein n=1 Tax=Hexamita inflata TaxID=28002 RepID=A0AA86N9W2_9EUKA|nr:Hypothetical protein HINF_LOCUS2996 [Hexamita inflata]
MFSNHAKSNFAIPRIYVNCLLPLMRWMNSFSYDNFNSELLTSLSAEQLSFINSMHNKQSLPIFQQYTLYLEQRLMSDEISRKMNHWLKYTQKISEEYIIPARKTKYQFYKMFESNRYWHTRCQRQIQVTRWRMMTYAATIWFRTRQAGVISNYAFNIERAQQQARKQM